jgi:sulfite reductase (NADPH) hemoprotein beta-component
MSAVDDLRTLGRARLGFADAADVELFVETLARFERGEISPDEWRAFRLIHGTYAQRQEEVQMLRVKIPQGILTAPQLDAIADVASAWSRGFAHVTTRQNVQLHFLSPGDVEAALRRLLDAGLTTREACGNSVRNVTACPFAGVAADERFDVTPYADALTRHLLRHPLSSTLPRKFKIAFEGCAEDHAVTAINDLGFSALIREGERGFRVVAGGGTGTLPTAARELVDFVPAGEILGVAEAILRVFHRRGDREHKERNRMKFLIRAIGFDAWRMEVLREWSALATEGAPSLPFDPASPPEEKAPAWPRPEPPHAREASQAETAPLRGPGLVPAAPRRDVSLEAFRRTNVRPQRQAGFSLVLVTLPLGDVTAPQLRLLGRLAAAYGDGTVRLTHAQDLLFRWVRTEDVPPLFARLGLAGLGGSGAETVSDVTSCPGAESCRLAVTHSRGLGRLLHEQLAGRPALAALAPRLNLKVSGCPNGCGQHHIAGIGFQGGVRQVGGKAVPQYFVMTGGEIAGGEAVFAKTVARIPARRVPEAVERLLKLYGSEGAPGETPAAYFRRIGVGRQKELLADLERLTPYDARPEDFLDPGQEGDAAFAVELKTGECAS